MRKPPRSQPPSLQPPINRKPVVEQPSLVKPVVPRDYGVKPKPMKLNGVNLSLQEWLKLDAELQAMVKHDQQRLTKRGGKAHPDWPIKPPKDHGDLE